MNARLPPELHVGFDEIDHQHLHVVACMERAATAAEAGDAAATRRAVAALGDALVTHFASEEAYMAESLYPDRGRHKAAHDIFMQDFAQLARELEQGLSDLARHWVAIRVPEWVKFHIGVNDVPLGQYLSARRFQPDVARPAAAKPRPS